MDKKKHKNFCELSGKDLGVFFLLPHVPEDLERWNVCYRPERTGFSGSSLDFTPVFEYIKLTRWFIQSRHHSWIRHHCDSGFSLAVTWKMFHCRISTISFSQPSNCPPATFMGYNVCGAETQRPNSPKSQRTLNITLGIMPFLKKQRKKNTRKLICHLDVFPAPLAEHCCWCAQGMSRIKRVQTTISGLCLQPGFTERGLKIAIAFRKITAENNTHKTFLLCILWTWGRGTTLLLP